MGGKSFRSLVIVCAMALMTAFLLVGCQSAEQPLQEANQLSWRELPVEQQTLLDDIGSLNDQQYYYYDYQVQDAVTTVSYTHLDVYKRQILILGGTYLMIERQSGEDATPKNKNWLFWAVLSAIFASLTAILGKIGITGVESNLGTAIRTMVVLLLAWAIVFAQGTQKEICRIDKKSWLFLLLSGVATGCSWLFYYRALQEGPASIVAPIDKLSILFTVGFSYLLLREKLNKKALLGLIILTAGTLLLLWKF